MTLTFDLPAETVVQARQVAEAQGLDFSTFVRDAIERRLPPAVAPASLSDAALLAKINEGFPVSFWSRYRWLIVRRNDKTLTPTQQQELIAHSDQLESYDAERLSWLKELADRRGVLVSELILNFQRVI